MIIHSPIIKTSITLTIFLLLLLASIFSKKISKKKTLRQLKEEKIALTIMKILSTLAVINFTIFIFSGRKPSITSIIPWIKKSKISSLLSIFIDINFIYFSTVALLVTWSIIEFSTYYMHTDPFKNKFFRLLLIFLLNMLILTSAKNFFLFFIGWEGVGFLSFLLIRWWTTRQDTKTAALQAIIYNRIGDIGIIILITGLLITTKRWDLKRLTSSFFHLKKNWKNLILFSCLLGAIGKSAQFGLHPWLPAAMEGPTPVSALLHRSTMVVAGVFLLIRITTITLPSQIFLNTCLIIGRLTAIFAATSAFQQHDIKKIIAYSTTRQLGLMVVALGLGKPLIALFHICTHAFFKAMLFLCSGSIIHRYKKEQDLRKISKIKKQLPVTSACLFLGRIALMGIPFLRGFYSKDLILESIVKSPQNFIAYTLAIAATFLTAAYSFRIITFCFNKKTRKKAIKPIKEEKPKIYLPLTRLGIGSIIIGWCFSAYLLNLPNLSPTTIIKELPLIVTILGATIARSLIIYKTKNKLKTTFFSKTWFYQQITHSTLIKLTKNIALTLSTRTLDRGWKETTGGQGIFLSNKKITKKQQITQTGYIKQYLLSIFLITSSIGLLLFSL